MKKRKMIFWFRFLAVIDVLFSSKFELITWDKDWRQTSQTKFDKAEILNNLSD